MGLKLREIPTRAPTPSPARRALADHLAACKRAGAAAEEARAPLARLTSATDLAQKAAQALAKFDAADDTRLLEWADRGNGARPEPRLAERAALVAACNDAGVAAASAERVRPGLESALGDALREAVALNAATPAAIDAVLGEELEALIADVRLKMLEGERVQFVIAAHFDVHGQRARARHDTAALRENERLGKLAAAPLWPLTTFDACRVQVRALADELAADPAATFQTPGDPKSQAAAA